jgi:hypothetical protein
MNSKATESADIPSGLVGVEACIKRVFPDPEGAPSKRCFLDWKAKGYLPFIQIGARGRVFYSPEDVRAALDKQFTVHAR